jgi:hypothetical protein
MKHCTSYMLAGELNRMFLGVWFVDTRIFLFLLLTTAVLFSSKKKNNCSIGLAAYEGKARGYICNFGWYHY